MSESIGNRITTEIDYKAEVLKKHPEAQLETINPGYGTGHEEFRIRIDEKGVRGRYLAAAFAFTAAAAWQYAYEAIKDEPAKIKVEPVDKLPSFEDEIARHVDEQEAKRTSNK